MYSMSWDRSLMARQLVDGLRCVAVGVSPDGRVFTGSADTNTNTTVKPWRRHSHPGLGKHLALWPAPWHATRQQ
ncbi:hypothetical protein PR202_ga17606 [Eleusine coracana subsp. coracana]|uniref:Uncharacterized protein n=1 Tax=Eleusine coracana subsp. coracana TaxID=191504 RepID=A0AAV5CQV7_ELECO|nr:hypothetical protein PR202_ga17359 [Eleusine coracana subsp. coracana]GJN00424.1 hypothetical protein PR202_ga17606 [Eleusine coracana subsp. coracana]